MEVPFLLSSKYGESAPGPGAVGLPPCAARLLFALFFFNDIQRLYFSFLFICTGCAGSSLLHGLSLTAVSRGCSLAVCTGSSLRWLLLLQSSGSRASRLQQLPLVGSRPQAQQLWLMGLVALWHVGSFQNRDQTMSPAWPRGQPRDFSPNASGGLTPSSPHRELQEIPVATREQSGVLCFHLR